jgi:hypothetical protein
MHEFGEGKSDTSEWVVQSAALNVCPLVPEKSRHPRSNHAQQNASTSAMHAKTPTVCRNREHRDMLQDFAPPCLEPLPVQPCSAEVHNIVQDLAASNVEARLVNTGHA